MLSDEDPRNRLNIDDEITTPWVYQFDLKVDRSFVFHNFSLTAFLYIQNIFNRKNIKHVYRRSGQVYNDGFAELKFYGKVFGPEYKRMYELINILHRQHYQIEQGGDLFGKPREIRFGLQIDLGR